MANLLKNTKFGQFQDFPPGGKFFGGGPNLIRRHGLAHGEAFRRWFSKELEGKTFAAVKAPNGVDYRLKLIAADVTNRPANQHVSTWLPTRATGLRTVTVTCRSFDGA